MPYAPGQQQQILGNRTLDRLQLPGAESDITQAATSTSSSEATGQPTGASSSEATVSGLGYLTNSSGQGFGYGLADENGSLTISPAGATGSRNTSNETSSASPSRWECQYWSSVQSSTLGGVSETGLDGPPHAPVPGGQANDLVLSPISSTNASHVHNASMASPGLGGHIEDEASSPSLSNEFSPELRVPSGTANATASTSQLQDLLGENTLATSAIDFSTMEPSESVLATASDAPWSEGEKFNRGMPIYAVRLELSKALLRKGKRGIDACLIRVQTRPNGRFVLYSRRARDCGSFVVDLLREIGQHSLLAAAAKSAYLGETRNHEIPGGASADVTSTVDPLVVKTDDNGIRIADFAFCFVDSIFNILFVNHIDLALASFSGERDFGVFLRFQLCDEYGKTDFDDALKVANQSKRYPIRLAKCTVKRLPGIEKGGPKGKLDFLVDLSNEEVERMFVLQCVSKDGSSTHYVGLLNGTIYDNCASTGGKFEAKKYAEENLSGVRKATEIILRPRSNKNKKKTGQKRGLTPEQDENGAVQQKKQGMAWKKARFDL